MFFDKLILSCKNASVWTLLSSVTPHFTPLLSSCPVPVSQCSVSSCAPRSSPPTPTPERAHSYGKGYMIMIDQSNAIHVRKSRTHTCLISTSTWHKTLVILEDWTWNLILTTNRMAIKRYLFPDVAFWVLFTFRSRSPLTLPPAPVSGAVSSLTPPLGRSTKAPLCSTCSIGSD